MKKLTGGLLVAAVALGILAARNARRVLSGEDTEQQAPPPAPQPATGNRQPQDQGMIIQRNEPLDNGIAVHSPFQGDPGIAANARSNGRS
jgi:hypothetical protein